MLCNMPICTRSRKLIRSYYLCVLLWAYALFFVSQIEKGRGPKIFALRAVKPQSRVIVYRQGRRSVFEVGPALFAREKIFDHAHSRQGF